MIILFRNILFLKKFLACNCCFGLFSKIKKGSGTNFWRLVSALFFHKNVPYLMLCKMIKFQCHTFFSSQDIKQNVLLSSYLDRWWCHKLKDFSSIILWSNGSQRKNEGKTGIQRFDYLENEKRFLDKIRSIFHNYLGDIIWFKVLTL